MKRRERHYTPPPFPPTPTPTRASSPRKPLKFHLKPPNASANSQAPLRPLNCYKRRKSLPLRPRAVKQLSPKTIFISSAPTAPVQHGLMDTAKDSSKDNMRDSDNQNPSSILKDPTVVPENVGSNWFLKTPAIWKAVKKSKVFSQAPQQPHFMKLQSYPPEMREGIALGLMVTYANLIDLFKTLSVDDEVTVILEKAACLYPLEENGFDVGQFWTRLTQLLQLKAEYTGSKMRILRLELQLADKETEMTNLKRIQLQMENVSREIDLVKEMINTLIVRRDGLLDQTVVNGHEISRIKEAMSDLNLDEPARQEFASLLAEPL